MKKFFGILFLILGIVCLPGCFSPSPAELIGRLIGNTLFTFLPAYLLLRSSKKENETEDKK